MKHNCNDCKFLKYGELTTFDEKGKTEFSKEYAECEKLYKRNSVRNSNFPYKSTTCKLFIDFREKNK